MLLVYSAFLTDATVHGLGAREDRPDIFKFVEMYKMVVIGQCFSYVGVAASKSAVALFLLRIVVETWHRVVLWIIIVIVSTVSLFSVIFTFVRCRPVEANWSPFVGGECLFAPLPFTRLILAASSEIQYR
ncbi:hypothetical protein MPH_07664 [Macrophomina phaseolina MS6]|uniref:Rhodopsin domain-containing protein n=1 Tax=Macrophomina phaseolina (strain MS6) TaxID=1126212 RepID=K2RKF1_MACPH|nr:hypothetical protein MPH_07664 [Macrophomina phaseolina MS6]